MSSVSQTSPGNRPQGEARRAGEESFRVVADIAPVLIWMSDDDKRCIYVNTPWLAFHRSHAGGTAWRRMA